MFLIANFTYEWSRTLNCTFKLNYILEMTTEKKVKDYGKKAAGFIRFLSIVTKDEKISKLSQDIEKATDNENLVTSIAKLFDRSSSESDNEPDNDNALASDDGSKGNMIANNEDSDANADQDGGLMEDEEDQIIEKVKGQLRKILII